MLRRPIRAIASALLLAAASACAISWQDPSARPALLQEYLDDHFRELGDRFVGPLTRDGLLAALRNTKVLFLGDQHRDTELHRQILKLLDDLCDAGFRPVIGMEAIGQEDDPSLQEFVAGGIDLDTLRARVHDRWGQSWLEQSDVDHPFFRQLLELVRFRGLDAFPLEPIPRLPLAERDAVMARSIRRAMRRYPDRLVVVLVGHAHIHGPGHLHSRLATESLTVTARCSEVLTRALVGQDPIRPESFLRSNRGVLFFPQVVTPGSPD